MNTKTAASLLIAALLLAGAAHAQGGAAGVMTVEVFANSAMLVTPEPSPALPCQLKVYRLDAMRNIEAAINQQLPQTEAEAQQWIDTYAQNLISRLSPTIEPAVPHPCMCCSLGRGHRACEELAGPELADARTHGQYQHEHDTD